MKNNTVPNNEDIEIETSAPAVTKGEEGHAGDDAGFGPDPVIESNTQKGGGKIARDGW